MNTAKESSMTKTYLSVFAALAALTVITVGVSYLHLARPGAIAVAMFIAFAKVSLITLFFMHLKFEGKIIHRIFYSALFLVCVLLFFVFPDIGIR